jgi:hypothetical protein
MAPTTITRWLKLGRLYRVHRGVYSVGCPPVTPLEHAMAAVLACGPGAALSHGSALTLWGIWRRWERPFEVIVKADRRPRGVKVHRNRLDRRDVTRRLGVPVTTLERTLLDQAPRMRAKSLNRAVNSGRHDGHVRLDVLAAVIDRYPSHPGRAPLARCVGIGRRRPTRSGFEDEFLRFCRRFALPTPEVNATVAGHEVDALFVEERVIVELDSWLFHCTRFSFEDDRKRHADTLMGDHITVRLTDDRFENAQAEVAADLHAILAERRNKRPSQNPPRTSGGGGSARMLRPRSSLQRCYSFAPASLPRLIRRSPAAHAEF